MTETKILLQTEMLPGKTYPHRSISFLSAVGYFFIQNYPESLEMKREACTSGELIQSINEMFRDKKIRSSRTYLITYLCYP